jgi:hypothetical protein
MVQVTVWALESETARVQEPASWKTDVCCYYRRRHRKQPASR